MQKFSLAKISTFTVYFFFVGGGGGGAGAGTGSENARVFGT